MADDTPLYHRELLTDLPDYVQQARKWSEAALPTGSTQGLGEGSKVQPWETVLLTLLDSPTIASKAWIYRQYDHQVQNNTVMLPGGADAAVVRLRPLEGPQAAQQVNTRKGIAATVDCNARYVYLDPYEGAKAAVAEAARNLSCVGAEPLAVTDNLNFGSPEKPVGYWQLAEACRGLADGCRAFDTPVTGGNVSLYNETLDSNGRPTPIYPTPVVGMVGLVADIGQVCGQGWRQSGDAIYLLGLTPAQGLATPDTVTLGASEYLAVVHQTVAGRPPLVDEALEKAVQKACREGIRQGWVHSAHDSAEGGLAVALAEACISGQLGATLQISVEPTPDLRWDRLLFGEGGARILVSVPTQAIAPWESYLAAALGDRWQRLGQVSEDRHLTLGLTSGESLITTPIDRLEQAWGQALERRLNPK